MEMIEKSKNTKNNIIDKNNISNDIKYNDTIKTEDNENKNEEKTITYKSIIMFQVSLFVLYFIILLIGCLNFSFKLFQAKEKHLNEFTSNRKIHSCILDSNEKLFKKNIYNNINYKIFNNKDINFSKDDKTNTFLKYYFTKRKHYIKKKNKIYEKNGYIKIFICLNQRTHHFYSELYNICNIFKIFKKNIIKFIYFYFNEIKNAFFKKEINKYINLNVDKNNSIINKYLYYSSLLDKNNYSYLSENYINIDKLFYLYLYNICYYNDFNYMNEINIKDNFNNKVNIIFDNINDNVNFKNKGNVFFFIHNINLHLNDNIFLNLLNKLYMEICKNKTLHNYLLDNKYQNKEKKLKKQNNTNDKDIEESNNVSKKSENNESINQSNLLNDNLFNSINLDKFYSLYNETENMRNINKYTTFINRTRNKIRTINVLKSLNYCLKEYIINLENIPFYFFFNIFYDTPCYKYNKFITNLLSDYYKGVFLYFIIFIGGIHVFFSPFPITLVHFRRFFIYFLLILYRLFILYFIPSIMQYIFHKFKYFGEEYIHIFDYSDHVILFATLLFIISLETKAIKYTINHQKKSFDSFHYKYNRKLCYLFLKIILYYYYLLIFFFFYISYYTSKYFHTPNEIFVAYSFSTFSIFFLFYFFLYKGYFNFYNLGITSYEKKKNACSYTNIFISSYLSNSSNALKEKYSLD